VSLAQPNAVIAENAQAAPGQPAAKRKEPEPLGETEKNDLHIGNHPFLRIIYLDDGRSDSKALFC
jgi:hypothetical protein